MVCGEFEYIVNFNYHRRPRLTLTLKKSLIGYYEIFSQRKIMMKIVRVPPDRFGNVFIEASAEIYRRTQDFQFLKSLEIQQGHRVRARLK